VDGEVGADVAGDIDGGAQGVEGAPAARVESVGRTRFW